MIIFCFWDVHWTSTKLILTLVSIDAFVINKTSFSSFLITPAKQVCAIVWFAITISSTFLSNINLFVNTCSRLAHLTFNMTIWIDSAIDTFFRLFITDSWGTHEIYSFRTRSSKTKLSVASHIVNRTILVSRTVICLFFTSCISMR